MEQYFKQFRYFGDGASQNNITATELVNGTIFNSYTPITQLGIRSIPGTKVYFNNGDSPVIVGYTGLFELEFTEGGQITSMRFSQESIDAIKNNLTGGYLIIDILGRGAGE